jgi:hypothetical protein
MRIYVNSEEGKWNWSNPDEVSISTHIAIFNNENERIMAVNIKTEDFLTSNQPGDVIYAIDEWKRKLLFSSKMEEVMKVRTFIEQNKDILDLGNKELDLKKLRELHDKTEEKIEKLEAELIHLKTAKQVEKIQAGLKDALTPAPK